MRRGKVLVGLEGWVGNEGGKGRGGRTEEHGAVC